MKKTKNGIVHLVWHYPVVCQTPKEDFFKLCKDAGGGEIVSSKKGFWKTVKAVWRKDVHSQGRGFPFPEAACLFAKRSAYSPHNDTLGSRWYTRAARRFLYNRYNVVVSENEYGRHMLVEQGIKADKVKVLPIPVDYDFFSKPSGGDVFRRKHKLGVGPLALVVGIRNVKNPDVILDACKKAGVKAIMVGPCSADDADRTLKGRDFGWYVPDQKLLSHQNAVFVGQLSAGELRQAMDAADVFVCSSDYESFGLAVFEAAAAGLPLCLPKYESGSYSVGTFDAFRKCALFHEPNDADGLANNIGKYITNSGLARRHGLECRKASKKMDYPSVRRMYENFYSDFFGVR